MNAPSIKLARPTWARAGTKRPVRPMTDNFAAALWTSVAVSLLAAWFLFYALILSGLQQHRANAVRYAELRENLSQATTPIGGAISPQTPIAVLHGPVAGLSDAVIVEGTSPADLKLGIGHRRDTPLPGQAGVSILYGRSLTYGRVFADIDTMVKGQQLRVTTGQGTFTYQVDGVRRAGDPLPGQLPQGGSRLLLETSAGAVFGTGVETFVDATLVGKTVPTPQGRLNDVPPSEKAFGTDDTVVLPLVIWLQALLLSVIVMVWAFFRWGRWQAWVVGTPVVLVVLWQATNGVMSLLPNLI